MSSGLLWAQHIWCIWCWRIMVLSWSNIKNGKYLPYHGSVCKVAHISFHTHGNVKRPLHARVSSVVYIYLHIVIQSFSVAYIGLTMTKFLKWQTVALSWPCMWRKPALAILWLCTWSDQHWPCRDSVCEVANMGLALTRYHKWQWFALPWSCMWSCNHWP